MHIFDIVLGIVLLLFFILGFRKGFLGTIIQLAGYVIAIILVGVFGPMVRDTFVKSYDLNPTLSTVFAYILIFLAIIIIAKLLHNLIDKFIDMINLTWLNKILGGLFNVANCLIFFAIVILAVELTPLKEGLIEKGKGSEIFKISYAISNVMKSELFDKEYKIEEKIDPFKETIKKAKKI